MSFYSAGVASAASSGKAAMGASVVMPSNIRDEILTTDGAYRELEKQIGAARARARLPADFLAGWDLLAHEWVTFRDAHESWLSRTWYASYEKTLEFRSKFADWRKAFEAATGQKIAAPAPGSSPGPADDGKGFPWRFVAYAAGAAGVLWGISKALSSTADVTREAHSLGSGLRDHMIARGDS